VHFTLVANRIRKDSAANGLFRALPIAFVTQDNNSSNGYVTILYECGTVVTLNCLHIMNAIDYTDDEI